MSKSTLRKELVKMTHEQLVQIVLDAYDARKETKEYFEFFLNPDIEKIVEQHKKLIVKELNRTKWGASKARVSVIKRAVKDFESLNPGTDAVIDMYFLTLQYLCIAERHINFTPIQENYVSTLSKQIVKYADHHEIVAQTMPRLQKIIDNNMFTHRIRHFIQSGIDESAM